MTVTNFDAADDNDAWCYYSHTSWPPGPSGFFVTNEDGKLTIQKSKPSATSYAFVGLVRWDTSSIPDDAVISAATLTMWVIDKDNAAGRAWSVGADYYDFGGEPAVGADWIETYASSIFTPVLLSTIANNASKNFALTDLTGINKTGFTGVRFTLDAATPTDAYNFVNFANAESASATPRLTVTYSIPRPKQARRPVVRAQPVATGSFN